MQADLDVRTFDGGDGDGVALHHLSAVDEFASTSMTDTGVIDRLLATVPPRAIMGDLFHAGDCGVPLVETSDIDDQPTPHRENLPAIRLAVGFR